MQILPLNQSCVWLEETSAPKCWSNSGFPVCGWRGSVLISLSQSVWIKHLCSRCAAHHCTWLCEGVSTWLCEDVSRYVLEASVNSTRPCCSSSIHISMWSGTGPGMSSREMFLAFVQRGWQEQTVL